MIYIQSNFGLLEILGMLIGVIITKLFDLFDLPDSLN